MNTIALENALMCWGNNIIDVWFKDSLLAPAVKTMLRANMYKVRELIDVFTDENGNVLINDLLAEYEKIIPSDGLHLDACQLFGNNVLTRSISIKILERTDIQELKRVICNLGL